MAHADFVHLRVHSAYSLSSGAIKIKDLVALCRSMAMPAVAVADSGNLFGALEFAMAASEAGVQPIVGCELSIRRSDGEGGNRATRIGPALPPDSVVLLAQSEAGYRNILKPVSRSHLGTAPAEAPARAATGPPASARRCPPIRLGWWRKARRAIATSSSWSAGPTPKVRRARRRSSIWPRSTATPTALSVSRAVLKGRSAGLSARARRRPPKRS